MVPPHLVKEPWLEGRKILLLEPRRVAAAAVAARIAELLDVPLGGMVGYRVRNESRLCASTRIEVVTEGILTRILLDDPLLSGAGLVIFDEFHERSLQADLALALVFEVLRARPGLGLLVMSATMDAEKVSAFLGGVPVLSCPGRAFPVAVRYRPLKAAAGPGRGWERLFAEEISGLLGEGQGDILAFLPGFRELRRTREALLEAKDLQAEVLLLHGSLPLEEQRRVLKRGEESLNEAWESSTEGNRRIILATSVAETSLTVPGIGIVADSGWARTERFHPPTGMNRLVTERVTAAQAEQRKGRAGRLGPGLAVRFWEKSEPLREYAEPEILQAELSSLVLCCAAWGARTAEELAWLDPPPPASWKTAEDLLLELGALSRPGSLTDRGRSILDLGLEPRLGAMVLAGVETGLGKLAAAAAAVLEERDDSLFEGDPDFRLRLEALRRSEGRSAWRKAVLREAGRIAGRAVPGEGFEPDWTAGDEARAGTILAAGFPDRVARRAGDGSWDFASGRKARLPEGTSGELADSDWITAPVTDAGETLGTVRMAAPLAERDALRILERFTVSETEIEWKGLVPLSRVRRRAGKLTLGSIAAEAKPEDAAASFFRLVKTRGAEILPWPLAARRLLSRLRALPAEDCDEGRQRFSEEALAAQAEEWLVPFLDYKALSGSGRPVLTERDMLRAAERLALPYRRRLDKEAPDTFLLPTGSKRKIEYEGGRPFLEAKIQEVFGLRSAPLVCGRPLVLKLLSPAGRSLQITADLEGFWKTSYAEVRKEMRGRYPKHYWPENPLEAEPTRGPKPRKQV